MAFGAAAVVWSCGLDDSAVVSLDQDASTSDGSTFDGTALDSGGDSAEQSDTGASDAGFDAGPCPVRDLKTCDDDGGCGSATEVCTPPIGAGWTVVNLTAAGNSCSSGYSGPKDLVAVLDGGPSGCICSCTSGDAPSCANDLVNLGQGGGACTNSVQGLQMTNNCSGLSLNITVTPVDYSATVTTNSACSGLTDASFPDPDAGLVRTCDLNSDAGVLCENHRSCVPKPATGAVCIASTTATSCPSGYTRVDVASSFNDTRSCPSCGCGWTNDGCDNPTVTIHNSGDCSGGGTDIASMCTSLPVGVYGSVGLTGTAATPACAVNDGGALDGGVAITSPEIVCCSN
ncbi:MAG: hypothetical protein ACRELY_07300 [Polyangiaceae bacterium]